MLMMMIPEGYGGLESVDCTPGGETTESYIMYVGTNLDLL